MPASFPGYDLEVGSYGESVLTIQEQLNAISFLRKRGMLEQMPAKLKQAALAREKHPEASLTELAAMMEPPITKPAMNHRLKKLVQMAKEADK